MIVTCSMMLAHRGGTQRVGLYKGGNPKIWPILGGESSHSGGRIGLKFSKGGEYFAKEYPSWRGESQSKIFLGGYPLDSFKLAQVWSRYFEIFSRIFGFVKYHLSLMLFHILFALYGKIEQLLTLSSYICSTTYIYSKLRIYWVLSRAIVREMLLSVFCYKYLVKVSFFFPSPILLFRCTHWRLGGN